MSEKKSRRELYQTFRQGAIPSGDDFASLIDAGINSTDDGLALPENNLDPIQVRGRDEERNHVFDFCDTAGEPQWRLSLTDDSGQPGLNFSTKKQSKLFIARDSHTLKVNSVEVTGDLNVSKQLTVTGDTTFKGPVSVEESLTLDDSLTLNDHSIRQISTSTELDSGDGNHALPTELAVKTYVDEALPKGAIIMWSGADIPAGWALCDGTGDGPDLRDRFIVGAGGEYNLGDKGGEKSVKLTAEQSGVPAHKHGGKTNKDGAHKHQGNDRAHTGATWNKAFGVVGSGTGTDDVSVHLRASEHEHSFTTNNNEAQEATETHENRPPYYALSFIIKVK
ncbi:MAG: microcystin-dependent protein [Phenylobacterium sp.]|jgi:microcystin-dependent protein